MSAPHEVAIVGAHMTRFTKQADKGYAGLTAEAVRGALGHAGLQPRDVQACFFATVTGSQFTIAPGAGPGIGQRVLKDLGLAGSPIVNLENACASGSTSVREAYAWVRAGLADCVLAVGAEVLSGTPGALPMSPSWYASAGLDLLGWYALKARKHMGAYGLTREQLAHTVVKSRTHAALNPYSHFRNATTVEEVLASPMLADPLTLHQFAPRVDGAAAALVCSADFARSRGLTPTWIRGTVLVSGTHVFTDEADHEKAEQRAARLGYDMAGVGPEDLQVIECHDPTSIGEITLVEALGLCQPGLGGQLTASGATTLGGTKPTVNPSGGLLSRGHPMGASGLAQITEVVWHLRGEAGDRQVPTARLGAVLTIGASELDLDANAASMLILESGR